MRWLGAGGFVSCRIREHAVRRLESPSLALRQLDTMPRLDVADRVSVDVCHLNQDIAEYLGPTLHESISVSHDHADTGLGDWLFRGIALPEARA
jgi:hypothetical protein